MKDYILEKAIAVYSKENQILKTIEELAELQQVLAKYLSNTGVHIDRIIEELADVKIMIRQIELMFEKDFGNSIEEVITEKENRLNKKIAGMFIK